MPPTALDLAYVAAFSVGLPLLGYFIFWPRFRGALAAEDPRARLNTYRRGIAVEWTTAGVGVAIWIATHRSAADLWLAAPRGGGFVFGVGLAAGTAMLIAAQIVGVYRAPAAKLVAARDRLARYEFLLPHTRAELGTFILLAITAGVCEELLYRGFFVWALRPWLGIWGAAGLGVAFFGVGHAYQGKGGAVRATLAGVILAIIFVATRWLVPAMIVHALIDLSGGFVGYAVLSARSDEVSSV